MLVEKICRFVGNVKVDAVQAALLHFEVNCSGHDVAWREFAARVMLGHETGPIRKVKQSTFASDRFRDQEGLGLWMIKAGWMELDELHV